MIGGTLAVGVVCCGGGVWLVNFGMTVVASEIQDQLAVTPEMRENIGPIESFTPNYTRTGAQNGDDTFVYDVEGEKGKGYVIVKHHTDDDGREVVEEAILTMNDGSKVDIDLSR